ncbi:MAG: T9SS type A sorting domain-containing protein [Tannerella sp.]|nr:T9SS type A sorting domain-containing protein [Tannerella sp.]
MLVLTALIFAVHAPLHAQYTTEGKDFWIAFSSNMGIVSKSVTLQIRITATEKTIIHGSYTENPSLNFIDTIPEGTVYTRALSEKERSAVYTASYSVTKKSLHITADRSVSVYALNQYNYTTDATNIIPTVNLGTDYYQLSYIPSGTSSDGYLVLATRDGTKVYDDGKLVANLNQGEVVGMYYGTVDLTGKHVYTNYPVAYFTATECALIPLNKSACDCLYQQLVPTSSWGKNFMVPVTGRGTERIRVVASQDGTSFTYKGGILRKDIGRGLTKLKAGEFSELEIYRNEGGCYIESNKPVAIGSYLVGGSHNGAGDGDPSLGWIPPIEQAVYNSTIAPFVPFGATALNAHYALIITPTATRDQTTVIIGDSKPAALTGNEWVTGANPLMSFRTIPLTKGGVGYHFENRNGFMIMGYGTGNAESYYYLAASAMRKLDAYFKVNGQHYQDLIDQTFCADRIEVEANIELFMSSAAGHLKWFINGTEDVGLRDKLSWKKAPGNGKYTVMMRIVDSNDKIYEKSTNFTVSCQGLMDDVQTVQAGYSVEVDMLANDVLDDVFFQQPVNLLDSIFLPPKSGTVSAAGTGRDTRFVYTHTGSGNMTNQIDSFGYEATFFNSGTNTWKKDRAMVYVYIMYDENGGAACYSTPYTVHLREQPAGVVFDWFTTDGAADGSGATRQLPPMTVDGQWLVKPKTPDPDAPWNVAGGFPEGLFTLHVNESVPAPMRWTGAMDTDWHNPGNWVEMRGAAGNDVYEHPVRWAPSTCTDVTVSSGAPHFPELKTPAACRKITVENRAMLANPHVLSYDSARVEIQFNSLERDRFVMWSAPLQSMYSGDYHFRNRAGRPVWGDVYVNLFQQAHPNGDPAQVNMLTATFGELDRDFPLGTAFNIKVVNNVETRSEKWIFPRAEKSYTDAARPSNPPYVLNRSREGRFITDGVQMNGNRFELPVASSHKLGNIIQVVNPYLAYLNVNEFLRNNQTKLATGGYLIWDGNVENGFTAVKTGDAGYRPGMRYVFNGPVPLTPEYIPPLQSFFVTGNAPAITSVQMSPEWTTTAPPKASGDYQLRSLQNGEVDSGVLHITAMQHDRTAYATLQYERRANMQYDSHTDVPAIIFDANPLSLYTLTVQHEPMAIFTGNDFQSRTTPLGLYVHNAGEVTFTFDGLERFGHNVYLIDKLKHREIDLQRTPNYTFTVNRSDSPSWPRINDRFALRMEYTGVHNGAADESENLKTAVHENMIYVWSAAGIISELEVYNINGVQVYSAHSEAKKHLVHVTRGMMYLIKAKTGDREEIKKVLVS